MGLLWVEYDEEFRNLTEASWRRELEGRPDYYARLSRPVREIIYRDTRYNSSISQRPAATK